MANGPKRFWLIAGPNGVGKTTYAFKHVSAVSGSKNFVNLDEIARGLSPLDPRLAEREAARIALARARGFIRHGDAFSMETTMSGSTHLALLLEAKTRGLATGLLYFSVRTPEICIERVARRVAEGGHDVPEAIIRRRFARSHDRLDEYCSAADLWRVYEASGPKPYLVAEGSHRVVRHTDADCLAAGSDRILAFLHAAGRQPGTAGVSPD